MRAPIGSTGSYDYGDEDSDPRARARRGGLGPMGRLFERAETVYGAYSGDTAPQIPAGYFGPRTLASAAASVRPIEPVRDDPSLDLATSMGSATALPARPYMPYAAPGAAAALDPDVWLIALPNGSGGMRSLEGLNRPGAIRVSRPYGHLRSIRPVTPLSLLEMSAATLEPDPSGPLGAQVVTDGLGPASPDRPARRGRGVRTVKTAKPRSSALPAQRPAPQIISSVEIETDAGVFRVERPDSVLDNSDMAWALAHMEQGEPDSVVALPRRQLALLLTLLPTPDDAERPEQDLHWGWAHRLRGPWERGPLHPKGRLGRLIAIDPDLSGHGLHRACFELLGADEVVWALGVPCFRQGSVYELTPLGKNSLSRWLTWPIAKVRRKAGAVERPEWEIARVVYRVGQPRWPLAGVVEPLGPMGVSG